MRAARGEPDAKLVENRRWTTRLRGPFLLHAAQSFDAEAGAWAELNGLRHGYAAREALPRGCIVGVARLVWVLSPGQAFPLDLAVPGARFTAKDWRWWMLDQHGFLLATCERCRRTPSAAPSGSGGSRDPPSRRSACRRRQKSGGREPAPPLVRAARPRRRAGAPARAPLRAPAPAPAMRRHPHWRRIFDPPLFRLRHLFVDGVGACRTARRCAFKMTPCLPPPSALERCTACWAAAKRLGVALPGTSKDSKPPAGEGQAASSGGKGNSMNETSGATHELEPMGSRGSLSRRKQRGIS